MSVVTPVPSCSTEPLPLMLLPTERPLSLRLKARVALLVTAPAAPPSVPLAAVADCERPPLMVVPPLKVLRAGENLRAGTVDNQAQCLPLPLINVPA